MFVFSRSSTIYCSLTRNSIMKRCTRKASQVKPIIISSDSENEFGDVSTDDIYVPQGTIANMNKQSKVSLISNDNNVTNCKKRKVSTVRSSAGRKKRITESGVENVNVESVDNMNDSTRSKQMVPRSRTRNIKIEAKSSDKEYIKETLTDISQIPFNSVACKEWTDVDYVSEVNNIGRDIAKNVVELFNDDNTIPFIARYRRDLTDGMEPDKLRALKESLDQAKMIKQRANTILKSIDKLGQWTPNIHSAIVSSRCLEDLEHIYSLFKPASKRSLAEKAKELGLGHISTCVLQGNELPSLSSIIDPSKDGLKTVQQINDGIIHIIADVINKDKTVFDKVKELQGESFIKMQTAEYKSNSKSSDNKEKDLQRKYEIYYDFTTNNKIIKPHQILAINRAETQKILSVKFTLPDFFERKFKAHCCKQYESAMSTSKLHFQLLRDSFDYVYGKFIKPLVVRKVRSEMKEKAEAASIDVFVTNVKQLLLASPVRGKTILGIDPGFSHGCKLAVISERGDVLETGVIYPHKKRESSYNESAKVLLNLVNRHKCRILALGNATACRETELFINRMIKSKIFDPLDVSYTIVDEAGASIYSCSTEAKSEFPDLDINLVSAISIARRLQDPLAELVKVEPKHLGVGMYQHDLPEKQLSQALNEVVSEAVSFVGVDVNTASQCLLRRVAGLNASRANNIIEWRAEFGPFKNRQQLLDVKGIGKKIFEQCAGFIRVLPETSMTNNSVKLKNSKASKYKCNLLDQTWIHPESYKIAERFLEHCNCKIADFGTTMFITEIKSCAENSYGILSEKLDTNETTIEIIVKGLCMKKDADIRLKTRSPLFRKSMLSINDVKIGSSLTGAVRNVTHFGVFVDIGVGRDGLIPSKWLKNYTVLIGQRVEVKVLLVDLERNRINLELITVL